MKHRSILMGDIVDSSAQDPKKIQSAFGAVIGIINREYRKSILSPLTITLGDEFQGVIENLGVSFEISQRIDHLLQQKGVICRFVVGYGPDLAQRFRNLPYIGVVRDEAAGIAPRDGAA